MQVQTPTHLAMLRDLLTYRLRDLRTEIQAAEIARAEKTSDAAEVTDRKDVADAARRATTDAAEEERDLAELRQVVAALNRIEAGSYGDCTDCGEAIALQRLLVEPASARCAACQTRYERQRSH